jgi:hypothetical protein
VYQTIHDDPCGCSIVRAAGPAAEGAGALLILRCALHEAAPYLFSAVDHCLRGNPDPARETRLARMALAWATEDPTEPVA